jgi:hypothetical protein
VIVGIYVYFKKKQSERIRWHIIAKNKNKGFQVVKIFSIDLMRMSCKMISEKKLLKQRKIIKNPTHGIEIMFSKTWFNSKL